MGRGPATNKRRPICINSSLRDLYLRVARPLTIAPEPGCSNVEAVEHWSVHVRTGLRIIHIIMEIMRTLLPHVPLLSSIRMRQVVMKPLKDCPVGNNTDRWSSSDRPRDLCDLTPSLGLSLAQPAKEIEIPHLPSTGFKHLRQCELF